MGTWIVSILLIAAVIMVIRKLYLDKKNGVTSSSCGGSCSSCSRCRLQCQKKNNENKE